MKRFLCLLLLVSTLAISILGSSCDGNNANNPPSTDSDIEATEDTTDEPDTTTAPEATTASSETVSPGVCSHEWNDGTAEALACGIKTTYACKLCADTKTSTTSSDDLAHKFSNKVTCSVCGIDKVTINGVPASEFKIVYADNEFSKSFATTLKNKFNVQKGYKLDLVAASEPESKYEIVIGDVGRSGAKSFFDKGTDYASQNYEIKISDNKIFINVDDELMAELAKNHFIEIFLKTKNYIAINNEDSIVGDYLNIYEKPDESDIRITSFNILYTNLSEKKASLLEQIKKFDSDILCLQEYMNDAHSLFDRSIIAMGYKSVSSDTSLCTPMFYRDDVLELVAFGSKIYDSVKISDNASKTYLWALFKEKATGKQFIVIGTHFSYVNDSLRQSNANEILAKIDSLLDTYGKDTPVFLCGDLNCKTSEESYKIVDSKLNSVRGMPCIKNNTTYGTCYTDQTKLPPQEGGYMIDHAFITDGITVKQFQHIVNMPTRRISDHTPMIADIVID